MKKTVFTFPKTTSVYAEKSSAPCSTGCRSLSPYAKATPLFLARTGNLSTGAAMSHFQLKYHELSSGACISMPG